MKAQQTHYTVFNDPGHAWVAVKRAELIELGILDKISGYSYQRGNTVYLEEDCDASLFQSEKIKKLTDGGLHYDEKYTNKRSPIRSYESFRV